METRETKVLDQFPFTLIKPEGRPPAITYWHYLGDAERHNQCFLRIIEGLPEGMSVVEHFGGVGMFASVIENILKPSFHQLFDIDPQCVQNAQYNWGDKAAYGDAKLLMGTIPADFVVLDFPNFTLYKLDEWDEPFRRMFCSGPQYVSITDIANQRIGLHREGYSRITGKQISNVRDYMEALSGIFYIRYGYSIVRVAYNHKAAFILFRPGQVINPITLERYGVDWHVGRTT